MSGKPDEVRAKLDILLEHCAAVGRDPATIEKTISAPFVIRDDPAEAKRAYEALLRPNGITELGGPVTLGSPAEVADALRPFIDMGFETVIERMPAPYDRETIDRMAEVRELLDA